MSRIATKLRYASMAEAAVVELAIGDDDLAFGELVARRQSSLRNFFRRLCGNAERADDLAQRTFFQAWQNIRKLRTPDAFAGWLHQIAVRIWLQEARTAKSPTLSLDDAHNVLVTAPQSEALPIDLDRALRRLDDAERLCIVLAYNDGLSHFEIATATGWPLGTVKSHIARGAEHLRQLLTVYGSDNE